MNKEVLEYIYQYMEDFAPYKKGRWCYEDGILMNALWQVYLKTNDQKLADFVLNYYDEMIEEDGTIKYYQLEEYNIDNICPGIALFDVYEKTKCEKYNLAIENLRNQLLTHPRTEKTNFWHKKRYPYQVWLDGIYMGLVFYARYAVMHHDTKIIEDIAKQINNVDLFLYNKDKDLYMHAYDEKKVMQWANNETGQSPNVWSRSVGWLAMAYVEMANAGDVHMKKIIAPLFEKLISGLVKHLNNGMLYQVVDEESDPNNYLETSGSSMLSYSIYKGIKIGILKEEYLKYAIQIKDTIIKKYFLFDGTKYHLGGICQVAGLDNEKRDGTKEYYYSENISIDEVKGVAPFILMCNEN